MTKHTFVRSYEEVENIKTFVFETAGLKWQPGQFQEYHLKTAEGEEVHWFTIASAPSEGEIHISTRLSGSAYKNALDGLQPGDTIEAGGAEGDFVWSGDQSVTMVAAGIGVTPFRSMLVELAKTDQLIKAKLIYFGRNDSFAFREEFAKIQANHPEFEVDYVAGESVTAEAILNRADKNQPMMLSGPEPMVEAVGEELKTQGVELQQDWFPGYDETDF